MTHAGLIVGMKQAPPSKAPAQNAFQSLELLVGGSLILLTVSMVLTYSGLKSNTDNLPLFFTDWIADFAPVALGFFSGVSVFLRRERTKDDRAVRRFLLFRGLFLIILQLTWLRLAWTFNFAFGDYNLAGLMWMLGCSTLTIACLIGFPPVAIGATGMVLLLGHQLIAVPLYAFPETIVQILYAGGRTDIGPLSLFVLYPVLPWIGLIMVGYAFGSILKLPYARRRSLCLRIGTGVTVAFVILAIANTYRHSSSLAMPVQILAQRGLPPSQLFLMMTIGPLILMVPFVERSTGAFTEFVTPFGQASLFYYLLNLPLAHALACVVSLARLGRVHPWLFANHPAQQPVVPDGYAWDLWQVYAVAALVIVAMYPACRWYVKLKASRKESWLTYV